MKITHKGLLQLGFTQSSERSHFYAYKVVTGRLGPQMGSFHIERFKVSFNTIGDLAYMLEIIDYYRQ